MDESPPATRRFRLDLAYDGRPYAGWQSQPGGDAVQDAVESALAAICPPISSVHGSGRTDAGVSADRQVAHFDAPAAWRMRGGEWARALNTKLPPTIRALACREIDPAFHARFSALEKTYQYTIATGEVLPPLRHRLAWHQRGLGPADRLTAILSGFVGVHDFRAFSAKRHDGRDEERDTTRTLYEASARQDGEALVLRFRGSGFLYKMVRFLVGSTVYAVAGRLSPEDLARLLEGPGDGSKAPYCAPADGLVLVDVRYPEPFEIPLEPD